MASRKSGQWLSLFQSTHPREGVRLKPVRFTSRTLPFQSTHPREGVRLFLVTN